MASDDPRSDVRAYARLCAALAEAPSSRARVLSTHGLDEESWSAIEDEWQEALSRAIDEHEGDEPPPLVVAFDAAMSEARAAVAPGDVMSLEELAEATRQLQRAVSAPSSSADPTRALSAIGTSLPAFLRASAHWSARMAADPELAERFRLLTQR